MPAPSFPIPVLVRPNRSIRWLEHPSPFHTDDVENIQTVCSCTSSVVRVKSWDSSKQYQARLPDNVR